MRKARAAVESPNNPQALSVVPKSSGYTVTPEQKELIKRTIAKGATDDELQLFLWIAERHRLDPFTRQLHLVKRWAKNPDNPNGPKIPVMSIQIGIDGYRQMASRYADFGAIDDAEYEYEQDAKTLKLARIRVWKKGLDKPTVGTAYWKEYHPQDMQKPDAFMWNKMPHLMLAKCAESLALRKAYPDLADIYTVEEMSGANEEFNDVSQLVEHYELQDSIGTKDAPKKVAQKKIEELKEKLGMQVQSGADLEQQLRDSIEASKPKDTDSLFYIWHNESQTATITGSESLKKKHRDLLKKFWDGNVKAIVVNAEQLEELKYIFEQGGTRFAPLKENTVG